jgi:hypothetical protein
MTAPTGQTSAEVFTVCPACAHVGATVITATLVRCLGRVHEPDIGAWCACLTEYRPP